MKKILFSFSHLVLEKSQFGISRNLLVPFLAIFLSSVFYKLKEKFHWTDIVDVHNVRMLTQSVVQTAAKSDISIECLN